MGIVISIVNEKGGVAKTTSTASIGSVLSRMGKKVVLIDLDPQADMTVGLNIEAEDRNIFDCLFNHRKIKASPVNENLVLVGGDPRFTPIDFSDNVKQDDEYRDDHPKKILENIVGPVKEGADYVLMDCPPNREIIVQNALACSDYVLIPTEAHNFSVNGIANVAEDIERMQNKLNPDLKLLGIFLTRYRANTAIHSDMREWFAANYPEKVFDTMINENITIQEATQMGRELEEHDIKKRELSKIKSKEPFRGLQDYRALTEEILTRLNHG